MQPGTHYMDHILNLMGLTPVYILFGNIHTDDESMIVMRADGYPSYMFPGNYPGELSLHIQYEVTGMDNFNLSQTYLDVVLGMVCIIQNHNMVQLLMW